MEFRRDYGNVMILGDVCTIEDPIVAYGDMGRLMKITIQSSTIGAINRLRVELGESLQDVDRIQYLVGRYRVGLMTLHKFMQSRDIDRIPEPVVKSDSPS